jgi:hypothetical protein
MQGHDQGGGYDLQAYQQPGIESQQQPYCQCCSGMLASRYCHQCSVYYCMVCFLRQHPRKHPIMRTHTFEAVGAAAQPPGQMEGGAGGGESDANRGRVASYSSDVSSLSS